MNVRVCCILGALLYSIIGVSLSNAANLGENVAGYLFTRQEGGDRVSLPLKASWVGVDISPGIVETTVSQVFSNNTDSVLECTYLFPLPEDASVTSMKLLYADRVVESIVQEKQQAKRTYDKARAEGKKAALMERFRSNLFSSSVANFAPGETVEVRFSYVEELELEKGKIKYRLPLLAETKYFAPVPKSAPETLPQAIGEFAAAAVDSLKERMEKADTSVSEDDGYAFTIDIASMGIPVRSMRSSSHGVSGERVGGQSDYWTMEATLGGDDLLKDFVLKMELEEQRSLEPRLLVSRTETGTYGSLTFFPPNNPPRKDRYRRGRDVIFLIDHSGSMDGERMESAREGVAQCLMELGVADRFNIVKFDDSFDFYSERFVAASPVALSEGIKYARSIVSAGGTQMQPALSASLAAFEADSPNEKLVVFLTDGAVGNESELIALLRRELGDARLFTFGIGSAPNEFLVKQMAAAGRGQSRFIMEDSEVAEEIGSLFRVLDTPYLSDVELAFFDAAGAKLEVEHLPFPVANVYAGHPVQIVFRTESVVPASLVLSGLRGSRKEEMKIDIPSEAKGPESLEVLFGRHLIDRLMLSLYAAKNSQERETIKDQIIEVSVLFQLVTEFTSRVAVESFTGVDLSLPKNSVSIAARLPGSQVASQGVTYSEDEDVFELSPFEVSAGSGSGYTATSTLAGTRIRTNLKDLGSAISIVTEEFLEDLGITDSSSLLQYSPQSEVGGAAEGNYVSPRVSVDREDGVGGKGEFGLADMLAVDRIMMPGSPASAVASDFGPEGGVRMSEGAPLFRNELELGARLGDQDYNALWAKGTATLLEDQLAANLFLGRTEVASERESLRVGVQARPTPKAIFKAHYGRDEIAGYLTDSRFSLGASVSTVDRSAGLDFESTWNEVDVLDPYVFGIEKIGTELTGQLAADDLHSLSQVKTMDESVHSLSAWISGDWLEIDHNLALGVNHRTLDREMVFQALDGEPVESDVESLGRIFSYKGMDYKRHLSVEYNQSVRDSEKDFGTGDAVDRSWSSSIVWDASDAVSLIARYAEMEKSSEVLTAGKVFDGVLSQWVASDALQGESSRGVDFIARLSSSDRRFTADVGYYNRSDLGAVYRDWASEYSLSDWYLENGDNRLVDVVLRNDERREQEGVSLRVHYSPVFRFQLWAWYLKDWSSPEGAVWGGDESGALAGKWVLWDGAWDRLVVGGGLKYRNDMRFNDGFVLSGGFSSDFFARYEFGDDQGRSVQLNVSGLGGDAARRSRFDVDRGARTYLTFRQKF